MKLNITSLILSLILCAEASSAYALNWLKVNEDSKTKVYVDTESITNINNRGKVWVLRDYKEKVDFDGKKAQTFILLLEYDCTEKRKRIVAARVYSEHMGNGVRLHTRDYNNNPWEYVTPGTESEAFGYFACPTKN